LQKLIKAGTEVIYSSWQQHAIPDKVLQRGFSSYTGETSVTAALKHKTHSPQAS